MERAPGSRGATAPDGAGLQQSLGFRRILVALGGSDASEAIMPDAIGLAQLSGAQLVIATVLPPPAPGPASSEPAALEGAAASLRRQVDAAREAYPRVSSALLRGDPADQLVAYAVGNGVDLIAMATRARWDEVDLSAESVADAVARGAPVPVLLRRVPLRGGEVAPFPGPLRVVVPLDGSRLAERALPLAAELAAASGGNLLLVQVIDDPGAFAAYHSGSRELAMAELRAAHEYLASVQARFRGRGVPVEVTVRLGRPSETITWVALDLGADLVAMATHGRSGARRERLGSVALALLRTSIAPLLLVPGAGTPSSEGGQGNQR